MSNVPGNMKALRGGIYQQRDERNRKRRAIAAANARYYRKNPPMLELAPLAEPKTRKLGIGAPLHIRRRQQVRPLRTRLKRGIKIAA